MGSCISQSQRQDKENIDTKGHNKASKDKFSKNKMNQTQIDLLSLLFEDLASRSGKNKIIRDDFDVFFHLNGFWEQQIFGYFDSNHQNQLSFFEFKTGIEKLVKSPLQQKVHALFGFYDTGRTNSVCYFDIITMMFSYQKDEISKIIDDEKFVSSLDAESKKYHFGKKYSVEQTQIVQEIGTEKTMQSHSLKTYNNKILSKKSILSFNSQQYQTCNHTLKRKSSGSISYFDVLSRRNIKIASSISMIVRKYVDFLFDQLKLRKQTDTITQEQFTYLISKHQQIFYSYYQGFHNYIWEINENNVPISKNIPSWISSECQFFDEINQISNKVYIKYIRSTLFIYGNKDDAFPFKIINLQGLLLEQLEINEKFGFVLKHPNGYYPEKQFIFEQKIISQQWIKHLKHLKTPSFHQKYRLFQKIGSGNFSIVYRGLQKKTNTEVAVKIIQKQKLSSVASYIIRHQCEVLQLCHHPCIVKFKEKIESKTHIFIVTQLLTDGDLYDYIYEKKRLTETQASFIMKQLLQTIQYLDALGLIHRDIKPENIIVRKQNNQIQRVKLIDFGFAVFKNSLESLKKCQKFAGTPGYSAPQIIKLQSYDSSIDNFGLGVLLYFMLSGSLPFDGQNIDQIKKQTVQGSIQMKNQIWKIISEEAKNLTLSLLKPREQRMTIQQALKHPWFQNQHIKIMVQEQIT